MKPTIKTVEGAFAYLGREYRLPDFSFMPEAERKYFEDHFKLTVVKEALNTEANGGKKWVVDYFNRVPKWYAWPEVKCSEEQPAGSGFSYSNADCDYTSTGLGSRQYVKTEAIVKHIYEHFGDLLKTVLLG